MSKITCRLLFSGISARDRQVRSMQGGMVVVYMYFECRQINVDADQNRQARSIGSFSRARPRHHGDHSFYNQGLIKTYNLPLSPCWLRGICGQDAVQPGSPESLEGILPNVLSAGFPTPIPVLRCCDYQDWEAHYQTCRRPVVTRGIYCHGLRSYRVLGKIYCEPTREKRMSGCGSLPGGDEQEALKAYWRLGKSCLHGVGCKEYTIN